MDSTNFYESMKNLSDFFGKNLNEAQANFYFKETSYITKESFKHAVNSFLRERKPNPANFPTISEIQSLCPKDNSGQSGYRQDETEEQYYRRINITHLWAALNILKNQGNEKFMEYCRRMHFSEDDIDRVQCKFKMAFKNEFKFKIKSFQKTDHNKRINELRNQAQELTGDVPF